MIIAIGWTLLIAVLALVVLLAICVRLERRYWHKQKLMDELAEKQRREQMLYRDYVENGGR